MTVNAPAVKALAVPELRERLARQGVETIGSTPDEFGKVLREEWARWEKVIRVAGLKGQ